LKYNRNVSRVVGREEHRDKYSITSSSIIELLGNDGPLPFHPQASPRIFHSAESTFIILGTHYEYNIMHPKNWTRDEDRMLCQCAIEAERREGDPGETFQR
jgi:hypothetical protein